MHPFWKCPRCPSPAKLLPEDVRTTHQRPWNFASSEGTKLGNGELWTVLLRSIVGCCGYLKWIQMANQKDCKPVEFGVFATKRTHLRHRGMLKPTQHDLISRSVRNFFLRSKAGSVNLERGILGILPRMKTLTHCCVAFLGPKVQSIRR